jgi:hypothetical protein
MRPAPLRSPGAPGCAAVLDNPGGVEPGLPRQAVALRDGKSRRRRPTQLTSTLAQLTSTPRSGYAAQGTSALPPGGFAELMGSEGTQLFTLQQVAWEAQRLPQASTCFNQLLLPAYGDVGVMREKLELAITETAGFGLR